MAVYLSKNLRNCLLGYNPISDRVMTVRIQAKLVNITFIQAYAPTNDADAQQTQAFYQLLSKTQKSAKSGDMVITMGDFNAKIPREHDNERGHVSMYGQGERSDNGDALVEFAVAHDLRMMNTFYKQHPRRLFTKCDTIEACMARNQIRLMFDEIKF